MSDNSINNSARTENNSFWSILREAVGGSQRDFTQGSIGLAIFLLAVPMIWKCLWKAFSPSWTFISSGISARIRLRRRFDRIDAGDCLRRRHRFEHRRDGDRGAAHGEKDAEGAARTAAHAIYLGVFVSVVMSVVGIIFAPTFLSLLGAEPQVVEQGTAFTRIMLGGNAVIVFLFLLNAIFRGAGDAAIAMRVLILANLLNIFLAPCFIYGADIFAFFGINAPQWLIENWIFPKLGVTGAAVGTTSGAARAFCSPRGGFFAKAGASRFAANIGNSIRKFCRVSLKSPRPPFCSLRLRRRAGARSFASSPVSAARRLPVTSSVCA
jgi:hypothetical protein